MIEPINAEASGEARKSPHATGGSANESNTFESGNDGQKGNPIPLPEAVVFARPAPSADDLERRVDNLLQLLTALSAELTRQGPFPL